MRRGDPRMELRADIASPRGLRRAEAADRAIVGDDRPVDQLDGAPPRAVEPGLAIRERAPGLEPTPGARDPRRPTQNLPNGRRCVMARAGPTGDIQWVRHT